MAMALFHWVIFPRASGYRTARQVEQLLPNGGSFHRKITNSVSEGLRVESRKIHWGARINALHGNETRGVSGADTSDRWFRSQRVIGGERARWTSQWISKITCFSRCRVKMIIHHCWLTLKQFSLLTGCTLRWIRYWRFGSPPPAGRMSAMPTFPQLLIFRIDRLSVEASDCSSISESVKTINGGFTLLNVKLINGNLIDSTNSEGFTLSQLSVRLLHCFGNRRCLNIFFNYRWSFRIVWIVDVSFTLSQALFALQHQYPWCYRGNWTGWIDTKVGLNLPEEISLSKHSFTVSFKYSEVLIKVASTCSRQPEEAKEGPVGVTLSCSSFEPAPGRPVGN